MYFKCFKLDKNWNENIAQFLKTFIINVFVTKT